jgi:hypothetical protein
VHRAGAGPPSGLIMPIFTGVPVAFLPGKAEAGAGAELAADVVAAVLPALSPLEPSDPQPTSKSAGTVAMARMAILRSRTPLALRVRIVSPVVSASRLTLASGDMSW